MSLVVAAEKPGLSSERLLGELVRLAWPIAVSVLSYSLMTLVDTYFVARLGSAAVGGVGLGGIVAFTMLCFAFGLLRAVKVLVAQEVGADRRESAIAYLGAGSCLAFGLALVLAIASIPVAGMLSRFAATDAVGQAAHDYMLVRVFGTLPVLLTSTLREARYGFGDSRSPMYAALTVNLLHIPLNYALIFGLGWGVVGAAWSTVAMQTVECIWLAAVQRRLGFGVSRFSLSHVRAVLRVGTATGIEYFLSVSAFSALVAIVAHMSEADLAAHQIAIQVIHFAFLPIVAIGEAASVLSGQAVGGNRDELVPEVARRAVGLALAYAAVCSAVFFWCAEPLVAMFEAGPEVAHIGVRLLWVAALFQIIDALNIVLRATLRGTGDVRLPALQAVLTSWSLVPALTFWLGIRLGMGAVGGWLALTVDIACGAAFLSFRVVRGAWRIEAQRSRERSTRTLASLRAAA